MTDALASTVLAVLCAAAPQAPGPSPSPTPDPRIPRVGVESELVELDVVVTDKDDRPRKDLAAEDFEILEDGRPRPLTHFARGFVPPTGPVPAPAPSADRTLPFPDAGTPRGRHVVLAVDDFHLEHADLAAVRKALARFVQSELQPGDEVAVVATSGSLGALQQFTTDRDVLRRAVERLQVHNRSFRAAVEVPRLTDYQAQLIDEGDAEALDLAVQEFLTSEPRSRQDMNAQIRAEQRIRVMARQIVSQTAHVTSLTLASLERLVRSLQPLRGRKVIALFSGGFFLGSSRETSRRDLETIADAALRSGVVVYTVDARGLVATPAIGDASVGGGYDITTNPGERERIELRAREAGRDGLSALALDTGGLALFDRNDPGDAMKQVLEDSATYYRLGFEPQGSPRDRRFRKIEVRVPGRSGLKVRAATGYFSQAATAVAASAAAAKETPAAQDQDAARLLRTALDSSFPLRGLPLELAADFVSASGADVVVVTAFVDAKHLRFGPTADGREAAALDLIGVVVDEAGKPSAQFSDRVELTFGPEAKEAALRNGLTYRKTLAVRPGLLQARIAVREDRSGLLGSASQWVQVPDRGRQPLALSSIFVMSEGEATSGVTAPAARGSVSYDRPRRAAVSRRFPRGGHLDYLLEVYDRRKTGGTANEVLVEKELRSGNVLLTKSPPNPLARDSPDGTRAEGGRLRLDVLPPGDYELRIVATDRAARATATRSLRFTIE
jgi:VWFA-related protein